jgi:HK97 family phage major capsid protein
MADNELILRQMTELTDAVKNAKQPKVELQWDTVVEKFGTQLKAMVDSQVEERIKAAPVYRTPGQMIEADMQAASVGVNNRYKSAFKAIAKDGYHRIGTQNAKAIDYAMAGMMLQKAHILMPDRVKAPSDDLLEAAKALTSTGSGTGDELVPTGMAGQLWDDIFLASRIAANITTIQMPTNPFDVPLGLGDVTWRKGTENTATTASDPATAKTTLTATELVAEVNWSYTLEEDSIIALMPAVRARLGISGAEIVDGFMLNADATNAGTGNINLDDADPDDASYYLSAGQDGIRHQWLVNNTAMGTNAGGDALVDADILDALGNMGKYAVNPGGIMGLCDVATYLTGFLGLTNVVTVDKFGPNAVVLTGQLAAYRGVPIVVSASAPLTEADGKVSTTANNNTLGQISFFNRMMWYAGFRRDMLIEVDRDVQKRQWILVASIRPAVAAHGTRSSAIHTSGIRNILV